MHLGRKPVATVAIHCQVLPAKAMLSQPVFFSKTRDSRGQYRSHKAMPLWACDSHFGGILKMICSKEARNSLRVSCTSRGVWMDMGISSLNQQIKQHGIGVGVWGGGGGGKTLKNKKSDKVHGFSECTTPWGSCRPVSWKRHRMAPSAFIMPAATASPLSIPGATGTPSPRTEPWTFQDTAARMSEAGPLHGCAAGSGPPDGSGSSDGGGPPAPGAGGWFEDPCARPDTGPRRPLAEGVAGGRVPLDTAADRAAPLPDALALALPVEDTCRRPASPTRRCRL